MLSYASWNSPITGFWCCMVSSLLQLGIIMRRTWEICMLLSHGGEIFFPRVMSTLKSMYYSILPQTWLYYSVLDSDYWLLNFCQPLADHDSPTVLHIYSCLPLKKTKSLLPSPWSELTPFFPSDYILRFSIPSLDQLLTSIKEKDCPLVSKSNFISEQTDQMAEMSMFRLLKKAIC